MNSTDIILPFMSRQLKFLLVSLVIISVWLVVPAARGGIGLEPISKNLSDKRTGSAYRALIIGNNKYMDPENRWPPLTTAITDANAIARLLQSSYGFEDVTLLENATRSEILHALSQLTRRVDENDSVLLYYAGHGYLDSETSRGYWIPTDAVGTDHATFLRNSTIRDELNTISKRARHTLLISDSCFSGSLLRGVTRGPIPDINREAYYQSVGNKKSVQIITAGGEEFVDDNYSDSGHSPFSYFLLNELNHNKQPLLTASELSANVEKAVSNNTEQVPQSGVLQGAGDELGEFLFIKIDVNVEGIPKDKVKVQVNVKPANKDTDQGMENMPAKPGRSKPTSIPLPTL